MAPAIVRPSPHRPSSTGAHVAVAAGLLALATPAAAAGFVARPELRPRREFPSPGAFKRVGGRQLQAEGSKPARDRYIAEEQGHSFAYEYAGWSPADQILNVDKETSVVALACYFPADPQAESSETAASEAAGAGVDEAHMHLRWADGAVPGVGPGAKRQLLRPGDVIVGARAWGCVPPSPPKALGEAVVPLSSGSGFMVEVRGVLRHATAEEPTTSVLVRATTLMHVFRDLYIDFQWQGAGRRLDDQTWQADPKLPEVPFNLDDKREVIQKNFEYGKVKCENCYAILRPDIKFTMRTSGTQATFVSMQVGLESLNMSLSLGASEEGAEYLLNMWNRVKEWLGPELISAVSAAAGVTGAGAATVVTAPAGGWGGAIVAATIPLFQGLIETLNIELRPALGFESLLESPEDLIMNGRAHIDVLASEGGVAFEAAWDKNSGFSATATTNFTTNVKFTAGQLSKPLTAGLRPCLGLKLNMLNWEDPITSLDACPEMTSYVENCAGQAQCANWPAELVATSDNPDMQLCMQFLEFATDKDLDFGIDEPFATGCFLGRCKQTSSNQNFNGDKVKWEGEVLCLNVQKSALARADVWLRVNENDPVWNDQYSLPHAVRLTEELCPSTDCTLERELTPHDSKGYTRLKVRFSRRELPRRMEAAAEADRQRCQGVDFGVSVGVYTSFGGVKFPNSFSHGSGDQVVDPVEPQSTRPSQPQQKCYGSASADVSPAAPRAFPVAAAAAPAALVLAFVGLIRPH